MEAQVSLAGPVQAENVLPVAAAAGTEVTANAGRPAVQDSVESDGRPAQGVS